MKKMINQGPIVRYTASVCEVFFSDFRQKTFSAESSVMSDLDHVPFYSKVRRRVPIDPTKHYFDSKFEIKTTVHKQAEWKEKLTATR